MKDIQAIDNGARFHNVDLHIHSYSASHDVKDETMTPEAIVNSAVRQRLSVIAITDHNSDKNVQRALEHVQKNYAGRILVLPGVEVTTAHGHLLAYFSPDRTADLAKCLSRLDLIGEMGADNTRTAKSMADTIAEVDRLGGNRASPLTSTGKRPALKRLPQVSRIGKKTSSPALASMAWKPIQWMPCFGIPNMTAADQLESAQEDFLFA